MSRKVRMLLHIELEGTYSSILTFQNYQFLAKKVVPTKLQCVLIQKKSKAIEID